jgi:hypothetical protein
VARTGVMHTECIRDARREEKQRSDLMMESLRKSSVAILSGTQEELNVLAATLEDTVVHSVMATQGVIAILSATETQAAAREITTKIHTEAVNGTDVAAALLRSRVLQPRILLPVAIQ